MKAAEDYGVKTSCQSAEGSLEKQIGVVENFIAQKVDAILINAVDEKGDRAGHQEGQAADIPVIMMANNVEDPYAYKTLYPDYDNMATQARALGTAMGGEGDVALLVGARGNSVSDTREAGFNDTMKQEFPNIEHRHDAADRLGRGQGRGHRHRPCSTRTRTSRASPASPTRSALAARRREGGRQGRHAVRRRRRRRRDAPALEGGQKLDVLTGAERVGYWNIAVGARLVKGAKFPTDLYLPTFFVTGSGHRQGRRTSGSTT